MRVLTLLSLLLVLLTGPASALTPEEIADQLSLLQLSLSLGNHEVALECAERLAPDRLSDDELMAALKAPDQASLAQMRLLIEAMRLGSLELTGRYTPLRGRCPAALEEARRLGQPQLELYLHLLLVQAGYQSGDPALLKEHLAAVEGLFDTLKGPEVQLSRFITESIRFEERLAAEPGLSVAEFQAEWERIWLLWAPLPLGDEPLFERQWIWAFRNLEFWRQETFRRARVQPELKEVLAAQEEVLRKRAATEAQNYHQDEQKSLSSVNHGFHYGLALLKIADARRYLEAADLEGARAWFGNARLSFLWMPWNKYSNRAVRYGYEKAFVNRGDMSVLLGHWAQAEAELKLAQNPDDFAGYAQKMEEALTHLRLTSNDRALVDVMVEGGQPLLSSAQHWEQVDRWSERSLELSQGSGYRFGKIGALILRAEVRLGRQDTAGATSDLRLAIETLESYLSEAGGEELARQTVRRRFQRAYELLSRAQLEASQPRKALATQLKTLQLESLGGVHEVRPGGQLAQATSEYRRRQQRLRSLSSEKAPEASLTSARADFYNSLERLKKLNPRYADYLSIRPISFARVQSALPAGTALLAVAPQEETTYLFLLTRDSLSVKESKVGYPTLKREVRRLRRAMTRREEVREPATWLYQALIAPLESELQGQTTLAIVPSRSLHYLPFAALARDREGRLEFLVERFQTVQVVDYTVLEDVRSEAVSAAGPLAAFGNPDGTLPGTEEEVSRIAGLFKESTVVVGAEATESRLASLQEDVGILHLATHGVLNSQAPESSYLVLSGPEGELTVSDIYALNLKKVSLVTLSACETSLGEDRPGSSVSSLATAFNVAAAESGHHPGVIASLWKVADEGSGRLMVEFYAALVGGKGKAAALRQAQLKLLSTPQTSHPFYWASFILLGDWR